MTKADDRAGGPAAVNTRPGPAADATRSVRAAVYSARWRRRMPGTVGLCPSWLWLGRHAGATVRAASEIAPPATEPVPRPCRRGCGWTCASGDPTAPTSSGRRVRQTRDAAGFAAATQRATQRQRHRHRVAEESRRIRGVSPPRGEARRHPEAGMPGLRERMTGDERAVRNGRPTPYPPAPKSSTHIGRIEVKGGLAAPEELAETPSSTGPHPTLHVVSRETGPACG
jgi:hypothetical protein